MTSYLLLGPHSDPLVWLSVFPLPLSYFSAFWHLLDTELSHLVLCFHWWGWYPYGLYAGGTSLWRAICGVHDATWSVGYVAPRVLLFLHVHHLYCYASGKFLFSDHCKFSSAISNYGADWDAGPTSLDLDFYLGSIVLLLFLLLVERLIVKIDPNPTPNWTLH